MGLFGWRRWLRRQLEALRGTRRAWPRRAPRRRPYLETLETRLAPATLIWNGSQGGNWSTVNQPIEFLFLSNWTNGDGPNQGRNTGATPANGDDLVFPSGAANPVNSDDLSGLSVRSITFQAGGYSLGGNALSVTGSISDQAASSLNSVNMDLALPNTITVTVGQNTEALVMSGQISGAGGITANGPGELSFTGPNGNTYTGATEIDQGLLVVQKPNGVVGPLVVGPASGSPSATAETTAVGATGNNVPVTVNSSGQLLVVASDGIGTLTLNGGTVNVVKPKTSPAAVLTLNGDVTTNASAVTAQIQGPGTLSLGGLKRTFTVADGSANPDLVVSAFIVSGPNGSALVKAGAGRMVLSADNGYGSGTDVTAGALNIQSDNALGAGDDINANVTVETGAALELQAPGTTPLTVRNGITLNGGGVGGTGALRNLGGANVLDSNFFTLASDSSIGVDAGSLDFLNQVGGPGGLTKVGVGSLTLDNPTFTTAASVYRGTTRVNQGLLVLAKAGAVPGALVVGTGTGTPAQALLATDSATASTTAVTVNSDGLLAVGEDGSDQVLASFQGVRSSDTIASLAVNGGAVNIAGPQQVIGPTGQPVTVPASVLTLGGDVSASLASPNPRILGGAAAGGGILSLGGATRTFTVAGGANLFVSATVADGSTSAGLTKAGAGQMTLLHGNTYTGTTEVDAGTLALNAPSAVLGPLVVGDATAVAVIDSAGATAAAVPVTVNSTGELDVNTNDTIGTLTLGGGTVIIAGGSGDTPARVLTVGGDVTVAAAATPSTIGGAGALSLGGATRTFTVADGSANPDLVVSARVADGASASVLAKAGAGRMVLSGDNTYTGGTDVTAGELNLQSFNALGAGAATVETGAALEIQSPGGDFLEIDNALTLHGGGVGGSGALRALGGFIVWGGDITLADGAVIGADAETSLDLRDQVAGTGGLTKVGAGTLYLDDPHVDPPNVYGGTTTVNQGLLVLTKAEAVPGDLVIGTGLGGPAAAQVLLEADAATDPHTAVTVNADGLLAVGEDGSDPTLLSFAGAASNDTIASLTLNGGTVSIADYFPVSVLTLGGDVTANAAATTAVIQGAGLLSLGGANRTFTVADGGLHPDLDVAVTVTDGVATTTAGPGGTSSGGLTLTGGAQTAGFTLSTFATGFPQRGDGLGPLSAVFPASGGVLVDDESGDLHLFPTDADGQTVEGTPVTARFGFNQISGITKLGNTLYATLADGNGVAQLNDDGTLHRVIGFVPSADGIAADPLNGQLFVSAFHGPIFEVDPVSGTATVFANVAADGLAFDATTDTLYAAAYDDPNFDGHVLGFDPNSGEVAFDSGLIPGKPDGIAVGTGALAGNLFVNTNSGTLLEINLTTLGQTVLASGGSRGDFVSVDPTNNTLLVTQSDRLARLIPPPGGGFVGGSPTGLTKAGPGRMTLDASNTYTGTTEVDDGTLTLNAPGAVIGPLVVGSPAGGPAALAVVASSGATAPSVPVTVNGTGELDVGGTTFEAADTIGSLTLNGGVVNITGAQPNRDLSPSTLVLGGDVTVNASDATALIEGAGNLSLGGPFRTFTVADGPADPDLAVSAFVADPLFFGAGGSSELLKAGDGRMVLTHGNAYQGGTDVVAGVLNVQSGGALGSAGATVEAGAALEFQAGDLGSLEISNPLDLQGTGVGGTGAVRNVDGDNFVAGDVFLSSDSVIGVDGGTLDFPDQVAGPGGLIKVGPGTLILEDPFFGAVANVYGGVTQVDAGLLLLAKAGAVPHDLVVGTGLGSPASVQALLTADNATDAGSIVTVNGDGLLAVGEDGSDQPLADFSGARSSDTIASLVLNGGAVSISGPQFFTNPDGGPQTFVAPSVLTLGGDVTANASLFGSTIRGGGTLALGGATRTFAVADGTTLFVSATIADGGPPAGLTKEGPGQLILANANSYSGTTQVDAGILALDAASAVVGPLVVGDAPALAEINVAGATGPGVPVTVNGTGELGVNADDTIASLTFNGGLVLIAGASDVGPGGLATLTLGGNVTVNAAGTPAVIEGGGVLSLGEGTRTFTVADGLADPDLVVSATVEDGAGGSELVKAGDGRMLLFAANNGANGYSGGTDVTAGELQIQSLVSERANTALGSGPVTVEAGAALEVQATGDLIQSVINPLTLNGSGVGGTGALRSLGGGVEWDGVIMLASTSTVGVDADELDLFGPVTGPGGLTKVGAGTLVLDNPGLGVPANDYGGITRVDQGLLILDAQHVVPGDLVVGTGSGTPAQALVAADNATAPTTAVTVDSDGLLAVGEDGSDPALASFAGTASSDTVGGLALAGGTVSIATSSVLTLGGDVTAGASSAPAAIQGLGTLELGGATRTFDVADGAADPDLTVSATIAGASGAGLNKEGPGRLSLAAANAYPGTTQVDAGTLSLDAASAVVGPLVVGDAPALAEVNAAGATAAGVPVTVNGTGELDVNANDAIGTLTLNGGTVVLAATLTLGGDVTANAAATPSVIEGPGVLSLGGATRTFTVADGAAGPGLVVSATVADGTTASELLKDGTGRMVLSGTNTYHGGTDVRAGELNVQASGALGTGDATVEAGAALELQAADTGVLDVLNALTVHGTGAGGSGALRNVAGGNFVEGTVTLASDSSVGVDAGGSLDLADRVTGPGGLAKVGAGALFLDDPFAAPAPNNYVGETDVNEGLLVLDKAGAVPHDLVVGTGTGTPAQALLATDAAIGLGTAVTVKADGLLAVGEDGSDAALASLAGISSKNTIGPLTLAGGTVSIAGPQRNGQVPASVLALGANVATVASAVPAVIQGAGFLSLDGGTTTFDVADGLADPDLVIAATVIDGGASAGLIKAGAGRLSLAAANAYTGTTEADAGTLSLDAASAVVGPLVVGDAAALVQVNAAGATDAGVPVTVNSTGELDVNADDTIGPLALEGGTVVINGSSVLTLGGDVTTDTTAAATIQGSGTLSLGGTARTFTVADGLADPDLSVAVPVADGVGGSLLVKAGAGRMVLSGANSYSAGTDVTAGALNVQADTALGAGDATVETGAALELQAPKEVSLQIGNALTLQGGGVAGTGALRNVAGANVVQGTVTLASDSSVGTDRASSLDLADRVTGPGGLVKVGPGTLFLDGPPAAPAANDYGGETDVNAGLLVLAKAEAVPGALVIGTGADVPGAVQALLTADAATDPRTAVTVNADGLLAVGEDGSDPALASFAGAHSSDAIGSLTFNGGTVNIARLSVLTLGGDVTTNAAASAAVLQGAGALSLGGASRAFTVADGSADPDLVVSATVTGNPGAGLKKEGPGRLSLAAANAYTGTTEADAGTLSLDAASAVVGPLVVGDAAALVQVNAAGATAAGVPVTVNGTGELDVNADDTIGVLTLDGGTVVIAGPSVLTLGGDVTTNAAAAAAVIQGTGTLSLGGSSRTFTVADGAADPDLTVSASIAGGPGVGLTKAGPGRMLLAAADAYTGATQVSAGTLTLGAASAVVGPLVVGRASGGPALAQVSADGATAAGAPVTVNPSGELDVNADDTIGSLTLAGGTVLIAGPQGPSPASTLTLGGDVTTAAAAAPATIAGGGTLSLGGAARTFTVADGAADPDLVVSATVSDGGTPAGLTKAGAGRMVLSGNNTYGGTTRVTAGELSVQASTALGTSSAVVGAGAALELQSTSSLTLTNPVTLNGTGIGGTGALRNVSGANVLTGDVTLASDSAVGVDVGTLELRDVVTGPGGLTKVGAGALTFGAPAAGPAANSYGGPTDVAAGLLILAKAGAVPGALVVGTGTGTPAQALLAADNATAPTTAVTVNGDGLLAVGQDGSNPALVSLEALVLNGGTINITGTSVLHLDGDLVTGAAATVATVQGTGTLSLGNGTRTFTVADGSADPDLVVSVSITGGPGAGLIKAGAGRMVLSHANSYPGTTEVDAGTLTLAAPSAVVGPLVVGGVGGTAVVQVAVDGATAAGVPVTVNAGGELDVGAPGSPVQETVASLTLAGGTVLIAGPQGPSPASVLTLGGDVVSTVSATTAAIRGGGTLSLGGATRTFTVAAGGADPDLVVSATIAGGAGAGLTKAGDGRLSLAAANSYSGITEADAGTLSLEAASAVAGPLVVGDAPALVQVNVAGATAAGVPVTVNGTGELDVNADDAIGALTLNGGTVVLAAPSVLTLGADVTTNASATGAAIQGAGTLSLGGVDRTFTVADGSADPDLTVSATIADGGGSAGLTKAGPGRMVLGATDSYAGTTQVGAGTLTLAAPSAVVGPLVVGGGLAQIAASGATAAGVPVTVDGTGELDVNAADAIGSLTLNGGKVVLAATLTLGGDVTANSSAITALIEGTGTLSLGAATRTFTVAAGPADPGLDVSATVADGVSASELVKAGAGRMVLSGANSYSAGADVTAGALNVQADTALGAGDATVETGAALELQAPGATPLDILNALTLHGSGIGGVGALRNVSGANVLARDVMLASDSAVGVDGGALALAGRVAGPGGLTKAGAGALTLGAPPARPAANSYGGPTDVAAGLLVLAKAGAVPGALVIGTGAGVPAQALLAADGATAPTTAVTVNSDGLLAVGEDGSDPALASFAGAHSGDTVASVTFDGGTVSIAAAQGATPASVLTLGGDVTTTASATTAAIRGGGTLSLGGAARTFTVADGSADPDLTVSATTADGGGSAGLTKAGPGRMVLGATNSYAGTTQVGAGTLTLAAPSAVVGPLVVTGGLTQIAVNGATAAGVPVTVNAPGELDVGAPGAAAQDTIGSLTFNGGTVVIAGPQGPSPASILTLGGDVTTTASTTTAALRGGGTLSLGGVGRTFTVADGAADPDLTVAAAIADGGGSAGLTKAGPGRMVLGATDSYTGATQVSAGTLTLGAASAVAGPLAVGGATGSAALVQVTADGATAAGVPVTVNATGELDVGAPGAPVRDTVGSLTLNAGAVRIAGAQGNTPGSTLALGGDVTVSAQATTATIAGGGILSLGGVNRTFSVADGAADPDLAVTATIADGTPTTSSVAPGGSTSGSLTLTPAGLAAGFTFSTFATGFPERSDGVGPLSVVFPASGGVLVSDTPGNVRVFPNDADGQNAANAPPVAGAVYGTNHAEGVAKLGNALYMTLGENNMVAQINDDGTINHVIANVPNADGIAADPLTGRLFVSGFDGAIYQVDPAARTATVFVNVHADGLAFDPTTNTLYAAGYDDPAFDGHIVGFNATTGAQVLDSGFIPGRPDGTAVGTGALAGKLFANTNAGTLVEIDLATGTQTVLASGGSRGDFVSVDPTNNTLLVTQSTSLARLIPPAGSGFLGGSSAGLTKAGAGRMVLGGSNGYSGTTHVTGGELNAQANTALGTGPAVVDASAALEIQPAAGGPSSLQLPNAVTLNGSGVGGTGALRNVSGTNTLTGDVTLASDTTIGVDAGSLELQDRVTGPGGLTKVGPGHLGLDAPASGPVVNSYGGTTLVSQGLLVLGKAGAVTGPLVIGTGSGTPAQVLLTADAATGPATAVTVNSDGLLAVGEDGSDPALTALAGTHGSDAIASLALNGGTVSIAGAQGATPASVLALGGDVTTTASATTAAIRGGGTLSLGGAARTFTVADGSADPDLTVAAGIADGGGSAGLTKAGPGRMLLGATDSYTGTTQVSAGTLTLGAASAVAGPLVVGGGALAQIAVSGATTAGVPATVNAAGELDVNADDTIGALTLNGGKVSIAGGSGPQTPARTLTLGGDVTAPAGTSTVLGGGTLSLGSASRTFTVASGAEVDLDTAVDGTAAATFTKAGPGTLALQTDNVYHGPTVINDGVVDLESPLALGDPAAGTTVGAGATLDIISGPHASGVANVPEPLTLNGPGFSGSAPLVSSFQGSLIPNSLVGPVVLNADSAIQVDDPLTLKGLISGPGGLIIRGQLPLTLAASGNNSYAGTTLVDGGDLELEQSGVAVPGALVIGTATSCSSVVDVLANEQIADGARVTINPGGVLGLNGNRETIGSLAGAGEVILNNSPSGSGSDTTTSGTSFSPRVGTLLTGADNTSTTYAGIISGAGGNLVKVGTGGFTLQGNNTYSGTTTVNGGTLFVDGSQPASAVVVNTGGTLGGHGTTGPVTANAGGTVSPGDSPGILTVKGGVTFKAGSVFLAEVDGPTAGTGYDQLDVVGPVVLNGPTLRLVFGFTASRGQDLVLIVNNGTGPVQGGFAGAPEDALLRHGASFFDLSYAGGRGGDVDVLSEDRNDVFVRALFADFVTPSSRAARAPFEAMAQDGLSRLRVARQFLTSPARRQAEVQEIYTALGQPDDGRMAHYVAELLRRVPAGKVLIQLVTSASFRRSHRKNGAFLRALFTALLGHAPGRRDQLGRHPLAFYLGELNAGTLSRAALVQGLLSSPEVYAAAVVQNYETFLGARPTHGKLGALTGQLPAGVLNPDTLSETILGQDAYIDYFITRAAGNKVPGVVLLNV